METLNKVYLFHPKDMHIGYVIAAKNFKEARKTALITDLQELCDTPFIDITGYILKKDGKPIRTKYEGKLNVKKRGELGILWFECPECEAEDFEFSNIIKDVYMSLKCKKCGCEGDAPYE